MKLRLEIDTDSIAVLNEAISRVENLPGVTGYTISKEDWEHPVRVPRGVPIRFLDYAPSPEDAPDGPPTPPILHFMECACGFVPDFRITPSERVSDLKKHLWKVGYYTGSDL